MKTSNYGLTELQKCKSYVLHFLILPLLTYMLRSSTSEVVSTATDSRRTRLSLRNTVQPVPNTHCQPWKPMLRSSQHTVFMLMLMPKEAGSSAVAEARWSCSAS